MLVNNAGIMPLSFIRNRKLEEAHRMIDVNLKGVLNAMYAVLPGMIERDQGHVINVSSVAAKHVVPTSSVYRATKFGVRAISEGFRTEMAMEDRNIRVTDVQPGAATTDLAESITDPGVEAVFERLADLTFLDPDDIARGVSYVVSQPMNVSVNELTIRPTHQEM